MKGGGRGLRRARFHPGRREYAADEDVVREVKMRHAPGWLFGHVIFHGSNIEAGSFSKSLVDHSIKKRMNLTTVLDSVPGSRLANLVEEGLVEWD